tara:strand:- start:735 stop:1628 length:894 start_codon:yes stop_codon:yes gene_type:complete
VNGQTEESRRIIIRAETAGLIKTVSEKEGRIVKAGEIIARQDIGDRNSRLIEKTALVRQREIEFEAAKKLAKKGFRSDAKLAEAHALVSSALAQAKTIRLDLARTTIKTPFQGILENRYVENGNFVKIGDNIAKVVDLDPILAVGFVSERHIESLEVGQLGTVTLVNGQIADGKLRFISAVADRETRTFRVELEIPNSDYKIRSGLTGKLKLPLNPVSVHVISPSVLTLADSGKIGVRIVDDGDIVRFMTIKIISDTTDGIWVIGLRDGQRLITVGHEYVKAGQKVRPVLEQTKNGA